MVPFNNKVTVVDISGADLEDIFDVMARRDGDGVSTNVRVTYEKDGDEAEADDILIDGRKLDDDKTYRVATIDYLANGGDYLHAFTHGTVVAQSPEVLYDDLIYYFTDGAGKDKPLKSTSENLWTLE